jgi:hypothetical protein
VDCPLSFLESGVASAVKTLQWAFESRWERTSRSAKQFDDSGNRLLMLESIITYIDTNATSSRARSVGEDAEMQNYARVALQT